MRTRIYGLWRLYIAFERPTTEKMLLSAAWIRELAPPYRRGRGIRMRCGHNAVQVGWCKSNPNSDAMKQLGGYNIKAKAAEIGGWGARRHAPAEEDGRQGDGDTVRAEHSDEDG